VHSAPPPAYAEAINYPTLNAQQPTVNYAHQPSENYAHPQPNAGHSQQFAAYPPPPLPSRPGGAVSPQIIVQRESFICLLSPSLPSDLLHLCLERVVLGQPCRFCRNGTVKDETDLCCLIFLAILAFVSPFRSLFCGLNYSLRISFRSRFPSGWSSCAAWGARAAADVSSAADSTRIFKKEGEEEGCR
jgi:hypothetical protein